MRIEDSYTFPASPEQVFAALADADALATAIPGCERLIQLGPAAVDGAIRYEARLRLHDAIYITGLTVTPEPHAGRLRLGLDGRGPSGAFRGQGTLVLARQKGEQPQTVATYTLDLEEPPDLPEAQAHALANGTGRLFACAICDQLTEDMRQRDAQSHDETEHPEGTTDELLRLARVNRLIKAKTPYGEIVAVARESHESREPFSPLWFQYTAGMLAGLAVGLSIIALTAATMRRLFGAHHDAD